MKTNYKALALNYQNRLNELDIDNRFLWFATAYLHAYAEYKHATGYLLPKANKQKANKSGLFGKLNRLRNAMRIASRELAYLRKYNKVNKLEAF